MGVRPVTHMAPHITRITRHLQVIHKRKHISAHITTDNKTGLRSTQKWLECSKSVAVWVLVSSSVFYSAVLCCTVLYSEHQTPRQPL